MGWNGEVPFKITNIQKMKVFAFDYLVLLRSVGTRMLEISTMAIQKSVHGDELTTIVSTESLNLMIKLCFDPREEEFQQVLYV